MYDVSYMEVEMSSFKRSPKIARELMDRLYDAVADIERSLGQPADTRWRAVCAAFGMTPYEHYCWVKLLEYALFELKEKGHIKINDTMVGKCIPTASGYKNAAAVAKDRQRRGFSNYNKEYDACCECITADELRNLAHTAYLMLSNEQHRRIPEAADILTKAGILNTEVIKPAWIPAVSDLSTKVVRCNKGTRAVYIDGALVWCDSTQGSEE